MSGKRLKIKKQSKKQLDKQDVFRSLIKIKICIGVENDSEKRQSG
jgi:hypothetical protein